MVKNQCFPSGEGEVFFISCPLRLRSTLRQFILLLAFIFTPALASAGVQFEVNEFNVFGDNPLGDKKVKDILDPYTGPQDGIQNLRDAAQALEDALISAGHAFHRVTLPQQVLDKGTVLLEIRTLVVGKVSTSGNKHFSDTNLIRSLPQLREGTTPDTDALSRALAVANFNTAKRTRLTFGRGSEPDTLDARIEVRDRPPYQIYGWLNNTGSEDSTYARLGVGVQHRNLFDRDHNVTATYSNSPEDTSKVKQWGINYQIPIYHTTGMLGLFYVDSDIDTGRVADVFDVSGGGTTTGIRYTQVLNKKGDYRQRVYLDVVDKLFDNDVDFEGTNIGLDIRSRPISLNYHVEWSKEKHSGRTVVGYRQNLSGGDFNTDAAYAAARAGAEQSWSAIRLDSNWSWYLPRLWQIDLNLAAQYTDEPLINGEQLGLGGSAGPRGLEERETSVDRGLSTRLQLWGPPSKNNIRLGWFLDHGRGDRINAQVGELDDIELTSSGLSVKWQWSGKLALKLDAGYVLSGFDDVPELTQDGDGRIHASLVYRFF